MTALDHVDFDLQPGEIHALLGENGAGKSTLMNILCGLLVPTAGQILLKGMPTTFTSPQDAAQAGIGMVHQHFLLVPPFTVPENLALASDSPSTFVLNTAPIVARAQEKAKGLGWPFPPLHTPTADLPIGTQQRVEILKALMGDARILLFDEPTAVLAPQEVAELLSVMRALRDEGRSLVFVSHKLGEVMAVCDRVTVLRHGRNVGTVAVFETNPQDLAQRMVGQSSLPSAARRQSVSSPTVNEDNQTPALDVHCLGTSADHGAVALRDVTFALRPGEILGVAGVDGNGQTELAQALTGLRAWTGGTVHVAGVPVPHLRPETWNGMGSH